jgi:hypothetical protein
MHMPSFDRRRHDRFDREGKIEYVLNHDDEVVLEGEIVNISQFGLCFTTSAELRAGQEILFKDNHPDDHQTAIVAWVEKIGDNYYSVGLQFT